MKSGPKQVPDDDEGGAFKEFDEYKPMDKSSEFEYSDSTEENILKPGHGFEYKGNDLPEKM